MRFEYCNRSEAWRQAVRLRGYGWAGYRAGMPTLHYWGAGAVIPEGPGKIRLDRALRREAYLDAVKQDEGSLRAAVEVIARMRPHAIVAYTQALASSRGGCAEHRRRDWPDMPDRVLRRRAAAARSRGARAGLRARGLRDVRFTRDDARRRRVRGP